MQKIVYLNIGSETSRAKQKNIIVMRWKEEFEKQDISLEVKHLKWMDVLNNTKGWNKFKKEHSSDEIIVMYELPEESTSRIIAEKSGQNKYVAGMPYLKTMEELIFQMHREELSSLDSKFIHSPATFIADKNKEKNYELFNRLNIPTPDTLITTDFEDVSDFLKEHREIYLKPLAGAMGRGVTRLAKYDTKFSLTTKINIQNPLASGQNSKSESYSFLSVDELHRFLEPLLPYIPVVQEAINPPILTHHNVEMIWDLRFLTIAPEYYKKIISGAVRAAPKQQISTNLSSGGQEIGLENIVDGEDSSCEFLFNGNHFYELRDITLKLAKEASLFEAGVDFIFDGDGDWYVLEINGNPGYKSGYYAGMTLGDYSIMGTMKKYYQMRDFQPKLKTTTFEDIFTRKLS